MDVVTFVREHGMAAEVRDGMVWAEAVGTVKVGEVVRPFREWERVGTTFRQARDWLGY